MHIIPTVCRNEIAKRAYFYFLERRKKGIPDNPAEDWERAEADLSSPSETEGSAPETAVAIPLTLIRGIGPRVAASLKEQGVSSANDLADWTLKDFGERLPRLTARARNGEWIEQARSLSNKI